MATRTDRKGRAQEGHIGAAGAGAKGRVHDHGVGGGAGTQRQRRYVALQQVHLRVVTPQSKLPNRVRDALHASMLRLQLQGFWRQHMPKASWCLGMNVLKKSTLHVIASVLTLPLYCSL